MSKVGVIDTENGSASIYEHLGEYNTLDITDFDPKNYIKAIDLAVNAGMEVLIIDSVTHCWEWCIAYHAKMSGNSFQNWGVVLKMYDAFKNKMLQAPIHIITTVRKKEEMALETVDGKSQVVKKGMKSIDRSEMSYEYTIVFEVDTSHMSGVGKDRTGLFVDSTPFIITEKTGEIIKEWCNTGSESEDKTREYIMIISNLQSMEELTTFFKKDVEYIKSNPDLMDALKNKKEYLTTEKQETI